MELGENQTMFKIVAEASLDLIFSQAVLEHVDGLEETYRAMFAWLKPGGYASHVIDFTAHGRSPFWNGHWAYSDWEWELVRGKREFLLNREPLSTHLALVRNVGFELGRVNTNGYGYAILPLWKSPTPSIATSSRVCRRHAAT